MQSGFSLTEERTSLDGAFQYQLICYNICGSHKPIDKHITRVPEIPYLITRFITQAWFFHVKQHYVTWSIKLS